MNTFTGAAIDGAVLLGLAVVAPAVLGHHRWWWGAAASAAVALVLPFGIGSGVYALPALVAATATLRMLPAAPGADRVRLLAAGWAVVAATALVCSAGGWYPLGQEEPFVRLAVVHFLFAGTGALAVAGATGSARALQLTAVGPAVVLVGFVTDAAVLQLAGAVVLAGGVLTTAAIELRQAARPGPVGRRVLLALSGLAVWLPMPLAVVWAAGQLWDVQVPTIATMVRWHGAPNALGFVLCGLAARATRQAAPMTTTNDIGAHA